MRKEGAAGEMSETADQGMSRERLIEMPAVTANRVDKAREANRKRQARFRLKQREGGRAQCKFYLERWQIKEAKRLAATEQTTLNDLLHLAIEEGLKALGRKQSARAKKAKRSLPVLETIGGEHGD